MPKRCLNPFNFSRITLKIRNSMICIKLLNLSRLLRMFSLIISGVKWERSASPRLRRISSVGLKTLRVFLRMNKGRKAKGRRPLLRISLSNCKINLQLWRKRFSKSKIVTVKIFSASKICNPK